MQHGRSEVASGCGSERVRDPEKSGCSSQRRWACVVAGLSNQTRGSSRRRKRWKSLRLSASHELREELREAASSATQMRAAPMTEAMVTQEQAAFTSLAPPQCALRKRPRPQRGGSYSIRARRE